MSFQIPLNSALFAATPRTILHNEHWNVSCFRYHSGIEAVKISNSRGFITVLPVYGQMIWDACFDGRSLRMDNMFTEPKQGQTIIDTYGCFAFHSGLIRNGCPSPEDDHPLHGEMPCARMDSAHLQIDEQSITLSGQYEYVKGFGNHYLASPSVKLNAGQAYMHINMSVTNLAHAPMPLQYMCHINYAYIENATFSQNLPQEVWRLRESIPGHVHPTKQWIAFTQKLAQEPQGIQCLNQSDLYDPEIVFFADQLSQHTDHPVFKMHSPDGTTFFTGFSAQELNYATRWILHNPDQKVAAFVLPATCRPEGYLAAEKTGTLIQLMPGQTRSFSVETGIMDA